MSRSSQALPGSLSSQFPMIDNPEARRFPSPWIAEETDACFIIRDHSGYALAYVYFEDEPARRQAAGVQGYQAGLQTQVYSQPKKE